MKKERRESERVYPATNFPVRLTCRDRSIPGNLYNISTRGLAIEYEASCSLGVGETVMITLASGLPGSPWVGNVACTPVYEILTLAHDQNFSGKRMRQCGMVYYRPGPTQRNRIGQLLTGLSG